MQLFKKPFQLLTIDELYQLLKLRVDVFVVEQDCAYPELDGKDQQSTHYWFQEGEDLAACLRTYERKSGQYAIGRIATDHNYRGQRLAAKLIEIAINDIKSIEGAKSILLNAQSHLIPYYEGFGFKVCSKEYLEDGIPHTDLEMFL
ncbi:GNAT family N-acetyltransferase [Reichenbachiella versicolor]|uniref:GNAT family N-acetyltransferase n=1 Tax=Reichenbachiella versicolor TaxID=1821036 RepID=UPI000D6E541D|nr:GNAT family N-acetyltransferase [Reichenbachiella versicolor]